MVVFLNAVPSQPLTTLNPADRIGRFNTLLLTNVLCLIAVLAVWMPASGNVAVVVLSSVVFGLASRSNISLVTVSVGELYPTQNYGT